MRFTTSVIALLSVIILVSGAKGQLISSRNLQFVSAPLCCAGCAAPMGCCCPRRDGIPVSRWKVITVLAKMTRTRTVTVRITRGARARLAVVPRGTDFQTMELRATVDDAEDSSPNGISERTLFGRNLCPPCPAGIFRTDRNNNGPPQQACCPRRRTVIRTKTKRIPRLVTVTRSVTVTETMTPTRTQTQTQTETPVLNQTVSGTIFFDVDSSGSFDPAVDIPRAGILLSLIRARTVRKARSHFPGTTLATFTSLPSGEYFLSTTQIMPDDLLMITDDSFVINVKANGQGRIPPGPFDVAMPPTWSTSTSSGSVITTTPVV